MTRIYLLVALLAVTIAAHAQPAPQQPSPEVETLSTLLQEAQHAQAADRYRAVLAERRAAAAEAELASKAAAGKPTAADLVK